MAAIYQWFNQGEFIITSPMYPIEFEDAIISDTAVGHGRLFGAWAIDAIINNTLAARGTKVQLMTYIWQEEDAISNDTAVGYGTLGGGPPVVYDNGEDAIINNTAVGYGTKEGKLIVYPNQEDAIINSTSVGHGTLV